MNKHKDIPFGASPEINICISPGTQRTIFSVTMTWEMMARLRGVDQGLIDNLVDAVGEEVRGWIRTLVAEANGNPSLLGGR